MRAEWRFTVWSGERAVLIDAAHATADERERAVLPAHATWMLSHLGLRGLSRALPIDGDLRALLGRVTDVEVTARSVTDSACRMLEAGRLLVVLVPPRVVHIPEPEEVEAKPAPPPPREEEEIFLFVSAEVDEPPSFSASAEVDEPPELDMSAEVDEPPELDMSAEADEPPELDLSAEADEPPELDLSAEAQDLEEEQGQGAGAAANDAAEPGESAASDPAQAEASA
jgi:hypothetical protein